MLVKNKFQFFLVSNYRMFEITGCFKLPGSTLYSPFANPLRIPLQFTVVDSPNRAGRIIICSLYKMAQPDIAAVITGLQVIKDQLSLVPNIPTNNVLADRIDRINHNQNILTEQIQRMENTLITQIQNSERRIQNTQRDLASQIDRLHQEYVHVY